MEKSLQKEVLETKVLAGNFIDLVTGSFSEVMIKPPTVARPNRISLYVPNKYKDKRWIQIDWNKNSLSIAMDHLKGDISEHFVRTSGITYGEFNRMNSRIRLNNDNAVFIKIFPGEREDFISDNLLVFLEIHYNSYLRRVSRMDLID